MRPWGERKLSMISPAFDPLSSPVGPVLSPRYAWDMTSTLGDLSTVLRPYALQSSVL